MNNKKIRILYVVAGMNRGGIEAFSMNVLRNIDKVRFEILFLCYGDKPFEHEPEIKRLGSRIIRVTDVSKVGVFKHIRDLRKVMSENGIDIVHAHVYLNSMFSLLAAKLSGVKVRIVHSHSTRSEKDSSLSRKIYVKIANFAIKFLSTNRVACGEGAGKAFFGKMSYKIINNGIDIDKFAYSRDSRKSARHELGIRKSTEAWLHVGRLVDVKNQLFLIDVFYDYLKLKNDSVLLIAGDGPMLDDIKLKIRNLGIREKVKLLGKRSDTSSLYSAADLFILPSLTEGLPVTMIEAQSSGLPCVISSGVPGESDVTDRVMSIDLGASTAEWAKIIYSLDKSRYDGQKILSGGDYDVRNSVKELENLYIASLSK